MRRLRSRSTKIAVSKITTLVNVAIKRQLSRLLLHKILKAFMRDDLAKCNVNGFRSRFNSQNLGRFVCQMAIESDRSHYYSRSTHSFTYTLRRLDIYESTSECSASHRCTFIPQCNKAHAIALPRTRVPHISHVFREMWGATVGRPFVIPTEAQRSGGPALRQVEGGPAVSVIH